MVGYHKYTHIEVPEELIEVQGITNHKLVGNLETDVCKARKETVRNSVIYMNIKFKVNMSLVLFIVLLTFLFHLF